jgi:hypothetical protein
VVFVVVAGIALVAGSGETVALTMGAALGGGFLLGGVLARSGALRSVESD